MKPEYIEEEIPPPTDPLVSPLLTDYYQLTMAYCYWRSGRHNQHAIFDLFFRKNPFGGEYTIFAGLNEVIRFLAHYKFTQNDVDYLRTVLPNAEEAFFDWIMTIDTSSLTVYGLQEGTICFPRVPLLRVEGPIAVAQLMESSILCLVNYASLMATNASLYRLIAGPKTSLLEFGLRRAQGPNGAMSASRYAYIGGFDATSNVLAGKLFGQCVRGTHGHALVSSYASLEDVRNGGRDVIGKTDKPFLEIVLKWRERLQYQNANDGELAAFVDYALCFPSEFMALIDTFDTLESGLPNFMVVAAALREVGFAPVGVRLDSGDLAYLSKECRKTFKHYDSLLSELIDADFCFGDLKIFASNGINKATLSSLTLQGHEINVFGIGTHLVTCQSQPALGCVYKLVEIDGKPRIKLSDDIEKVSLPGPKKAYRLYDKNNVAIMDLMTSANVAAPKAGERVLCRHPFVHRKRAWVVPSEVTSMLKLVWHNGRVTVESGFLRSPKEIRAYVAQQMAAVRDDHLRTLNPTPYKVSVTEELFDKLHDLWLAETPISEMS